ncbi:low molecular weight protein-tyrosine-phosphatase [Tahibacter amnicola]|uniref:protein-tyrosine-phosphatase n=1 Tax=Tahibacter amnicola TaxID=2976241 RepID=A0ABY6BRF4_9GAMM|nr:low molecular weight protein-tyrosine-phosphatase [Tahibacter amnicola]UXI70347.1 low molecular weight phosphotyrosine protein phosphatase [Tahibacter amnicola]
MKILFVCLGNICRSPVLEAVLRDHVRRAGLKWEVASVGTGAWHVGRAADPRSCASATRRGYSMDRHRARQLHVNHFYEYDWLLAADRENLRELQLLRPADASARVELALAFAGLETPQEVPDPYFGADADFEHVVDLAEEFARNVLARYAKR